MTWSPPHIELCQRLANRFLLLLLSSMTLNSGCASFPVMPATPAAVTDSVPDENGGYTPAEQQRLAAMPAIPEFDVAPVSSKIAAVNPSKLIVAAPKPFAWERSGTSAGGRSFLTARIGEEGYRTLVVGSIGGNDPLALELVDLLARRLHDNSLILGGFDSTLIRTLNPDGESSQKVLNQSGQNVSRGFPQAGATTGKEQPVEVAFLLARLKTLQPQRVLHVRSIDGSTGLIAAGSSCQTAAKEAAEWLNFRFVKLNLPEKAPAGSMERYLATTGNSDIITFAIPSKAKKAELWELYGDTLLNLLLGEDLASREIARKQAQQSSADRRNINDI